MGELMKCAFWGASYPVGAAEGGFPLARQRSLAGLSHLHCREEGRRVGRGQQSLPGCWCAESLRSLHPPALSV